MDDSIKKTRYDEMYEELKAAKTEFYSKIEEIKKKYDTPSMLLLHSYEKGLGFLHKFEEIQKLM